MANLTLKNIAKVAPTKLTVAPGLIEELYVAPIADFLAIADLPAGVTDVDVFGLITTAHTFTAPKGFVKILDVKENTGMFTSEPQEGGAGNFKETAKIKTNGYNTKMVGFINMMLHQPSIGLAKLANGDVRQIGTEAFPAYFKGGFDSKTNQSTDAIGHDLELTAVQPYQVRYNYPTIAITIVT